jgi:uncharacterized membrane protein (DUF106 family)
LEVKNNLSDSAFFYAIVVFFASSFMSISSILLRLKFAHPKDLAEWQGEIKKWSSDSERARKTKDKKLIAQLKKQEKRINQIQSKMLKGQMLNLGAMIFLLYATWYVLGNYIAGQIVAFSPFSIPFITEGNAPYEMPYFVWYLICSFFSSTLLSRIFGISMGMGLPQTTK